MNSYVIYCASLYDEKSTQGVWGFKTVLNDKTIKKIRRSSLNTKKNRLELISIANALFFIPDDSDIKIICDSQFITNAINRGWYTKWAANKWYTRKNSKLPNIDVWQYLIEKIKVNRIEIRWDLSTRNELQVDNF